VKENFLLGLICTQLIILKFIKTILNNYGLTFKKSNYKCLMELKCIISFYKIVLKYLNLSTVILLNKFTIYFFNLVCNYDV